MSMAVQARLWPLGDASSASTRSAHGARGSICKKPNSKHEHIIALRMEGHNGAARDPRAPVLGHKRSLRETKLAYPPLQNLHNDTVRGQQHHAALEDLQPLLLGGSGPPGYAINLDTLHLRDRHALLTRPSCTCGRRRAGGIMDIDTQL